MPRSSPGAGLAAGSPQTTGEAIASAVRLISQKMKTPTMSDPAETDFAAPASKTCQAPAKSGATITATGRRDDEARLLLSLMDNLQRGADAALLLAAGASDEHVGHYGALVAADLAYLAGGGLRFLRNHINQKEKADE